ncbi:CDC42 small effector protein 2 isoform X1 [Columba livia]|uniref:CDC42 small effector protein 2 isoform X1 n=1 Tax=Columba livia TaxID=8932 RepID=UPI0031BA9398
MCIKLIGDLFSNLLLEERTRVTEVLQFRYIQNTSVSRFKENVSHLTQIPKRTKSCVALEEVHVTLGTKEAYVTFLWCWDQPSERRL